MKKVYFLLAISLVLTLIGKAQDRNYSFSEEFKISEPATFKINTSDGNIKVTPGSSDKVEVYYIVRKNGRLLNISKSELEDVEIEITKTSNSLEIEAKYDRGYMTWKNRMNVSFDVVVPKNTVCDIKSSDGNIELSGVNGDQTVKTSDGNVTISSIDGSLRGRTSDGNIEISQITGNCNIVTSDGNLVVSNVKGELDGRTSDGNAVVDKIGGPVKLVTSDGNIVSSNLSGIIDLSTSDGNIKLSNSKGNIKLKTSDGSIGFTDLAGALRAVTSDGDIRGNLISLEENLNLATNDGSIDVVVPKGLGLNLAIRAERINTKFTKFDGTSKERSVNGTVNGGGIPVELTAGDGSVSLSYE